MCRSKKAFSLLEVLLAMAIMLIASTMIMQGFMSTLSYSGNTDVYAKDAAINSRNMYSVINQHKNKNGDSAGGGATTFELNGDENIKFSVNTWSSKTASPASYSSTYAESGAPTSSKYAISYCLPAGLECPNCSSKTSLARDKNNGFKWFCKDCKVYVGP